MESVSGDLQKKVETNSNSKELEAAALSSLPASVQLGLRMFLALRKAIDFHEPRLMRNVLDSLKQLLESMPKDASDLMRPSKYGILSSVASFLKDAITGPLAIANRKQAPDFRYYTLAHELLIHWSIVQASTSNMLTVLRLLLSNASPDLSQLDVAASLSTLTLAISKSSIAGEGKRASFCSTLEHYLGTHLASSTAEPELYSFGRGDTGRIGHGPTMASVHLPQRIEALKGKTITTLSTFSTHTLCVTGESNHTHQRASIS